MSKLVILLVPVLCILAIELPFLLDKISYVYNRDNEDINNIEFLSKWYLQRGVQMPLNRFGSALYLYQLFGVNLIWGVSNIFGETVPVLKTINLSNGIFQFMAMYGLFGLGYFFTRCFALFRKYTQSIELSIYCLLVILVLGFSESIFTISFTMCFFFLYFYSEPEEIFDEQPEEMSRISPINTKNLHVRSNGPL